MDKWIVWDASGGENSLLEQLITSGNRDHAFLWCGCGGGSLSAAKKMVRKAGRAVWSQSWHVHRLGKMPWNPVLSSPSASSV